MTTSEMADAKRATDSARTKIRKVLIGAKDLDKEDRDYLQSAILALDWVRSKLGEAVVNETAISAPRDGVLT